VYQKKLQARFVKILLAAAFVYAWGCNPASALTIVNGSFEQPVIGGSFQNFGTGSTAISGWTVTSGNLDVVRTTYYPASDGNQSLDLNGQQTGAIAQTVATVIGVPVTIRFDMGANPRNPGPDIIYSRIRVSAAGQSQDFELYIGGDESSPHWTTMTFSFTPVATSTTLSFASLISGEAGPTLDNVTVPEPRAAVLVASGILGCVLRGRRRTSV